MLVEQLYINNPLANFNYLVACPETGDALAIDPLDAEAVLKLAKAKGWAIRQIVNTHEHWDHIGGNEAVKEATGATIAAHSRGAKVIPNLDRLLSAGDTIKVGKTVELEVLDTPGHTFAHVCLRGRGDHDALFSGDTLFNAGAGNCSGGGDAATMYETFRDQLNALPDETRLYPGHSYAQKNLSFTLDREPSNNFAKKLLAEVEAMAARGEHLQATMGLERKMNVFFRMERAEVIDGLKARFPGRDFADPKARFVSLRAIRDNF